MENWSPIPEYEGYYEASDLGRVRRVAPRYNGLPGSILKPGKRRDYLNFTLCVEAKTRTFSAHRLIWEAFNGPIPLGMQINHKNGDKHDNRIVNLETATPSENMQHAYRVLGLPGRKNPNYGEKNGRAKLTAKQVEDIRREYSGGGVSQQAIADRYGVAQTTISLIVRGSGWAA